MTNENTQKQLIFDPIFTEDIKDTYLNNPPEGAVPEDFSVVDCAQYSALKFNAGREAQALEILFTAVGRAWHEAKRGQMTSGVK